MRGQNHNPIRARYWHKADMPMRLADVRFRRTWRLTAKSLLLAKSGHLAANILKIPTSLTLAVAEYADRR